MNNYIKILIFVILGISQLTLIPILGIKGIYPNIVLIGAVMLVMMDMEDDALLLAIIGGIILDLSGPLYFGLNVIIIIGIILSFRYIINKFIPVMNVITIAIGVLIATMVNAAVVNLFIGQWPSITIVLEGLYGLLIGYIIYWQLHKMQNQSFATKI